MTIEIRPADFKQDFELLKSIRETVFVEEQSVPLELEWDEHDQAAYHLLAFEDNTAIATARILGNGKIGRMAVLPDWRHHGIGTSMLKQLVDKAIQLGLERVTLSAQVSAISFYQRLGFVISSETYEDAGIPHQDMELRLTASK